MSVLENIILTPEYKKECEDIILSANSDSEKTFENTYDALQSHIDMLAKSIENKWRVDIGNNRTYYEQKNSIANLIDDRSGVALNNFDAIIYGCLNNGALYDREYKEDREKAGDTLYMVLRWIHGNSCLISNEVLHLVRGGYAEGAFARARSLYEMSVVSCFIRTYGLEAADHFLKHQAVQIYKMMNEFDSAAADHSKDHSHEQPIEEYEIKALELIDEFGSGYKGDYGWACPILNRKKVTFKDIETAVGKNGYRASYKYASMYIHSGIYGIVNKIGIPLGTDAYKKNIQAGPSNYGISYPARISIACFLDIVQDFITYIPKIINIAILWAMRSIGDEIIKNLYEVDMQIMAEEKRKSNG